MIAGIDFGNKKAGTTAICLGNIRGEITSIESSQKGHDADQFLIQIIGNHELAGIFIDAPLSLPGVYKDPGNYTDYFYRKSDRQIGAMSPMFLGGLTARAMRLKDFWERSGLIVYEVWPTKMAELAGISKDLYKNKQNDLAVSVRHVKDSTYIKNDFSVSNWHEFDSVLAYISGLRILSNKAHSYGDEKEGLIYV